MKNLSTILTSLQAEETTRAQANGIPYDGVCCDDNNIDGNVVLAESSGAVFSFPKDSIISVEELDGNRSRLWVAPDAVAYHTYRFETGNGTRGSVFDHPELIHAVNEIQQAEGVPQFAAITDEADEELAAATAAAPSLAKAFRAFKKSCVGGNESYKNHCAHYLSDAMIRVGYSELLTSSLIKARCKKKRPIRAQNMLRWFQKKKKRFHNGNYPKKGSGYWAVYQEKPSYPTGHVCLYNANDHTFRGSNEPNWYSWPTNYYYQF